MEVIELYQEGHDEMTNNPATLTYVVDSQNVTYKIMGNDYEFLTTSLEHFLDELLCDKESEFIMLSEHITKDKIIVDKCFDDFNEIGKKMFYSTTWECDLDGLVDKIMDIYDVDALKVVSKNSLIIAKRGEWYDFSSFSEN
tara:strand:- start:26382 stop:26804 length:423 start_codon:yes stop_codon:yes gene_type:complete